MDGRGDDALGWLFADQFADNSVLEVAYRYQLQIEDAALIGQYDCVVFVDANLLEIETGFYFQQCQPFRDTNGGCIRDSARPQHKIWKKPLGIFARRFRQRWTSIPQIK